MSSHNEEDQRALREATHRASFNYYGFAFNVRLDETFKSPEINLNQTVGDLLADVAQAAISDCESASGEIIPAFQAGNPIFATYSTASISGIKSLIERNTQQETTPTTSPTLPLSK